MENKERQRKKRPRIPTEKQLREAEIVSHEEATAILNSAELAALPVAVADAWQLCDFILTQLHETLESGTNAEIFHTHFKIRTPEHATAIKGFSSEELIEWMKANQYEAEVLQVTYKLVCRALIFDLVEFATEAVRCTIRGPLTVAMALLRKPFKENLFYLEWLLADPKDFFSKFTNGDVVALNLGKVEPIRKLEIIRAAMAETSYHEWIEPEFLYELRFEKKTNVGLEPTWQKANHLITTQGVLATEPENFNFVFSTNEERESQWLGFYATVPLLLFHSLQIIEFIIGTFAKRANEKPDFTPLRTIVGMVLWMRSDGCPLDVSDIRSKMAAVVRKTIGRMACPYCGKRYSVREPNLRRFFTDSKLHCFGCSRTTSLNP